MGRSRTPDTPGCAPVTKDLSPHTIRAYKTDIAPFERHLAIRALVNQIDRDPLLAFMEEAAIAFSRRDMHGNVDWKRRGVGWNQMVVLDGRQQHHQPGTEVSVAGQRAGRVEPKDQGRKPCPRADRQAS